MTDAEMDRLQQVAWGQADATTRERMELALLVIRETFNRGGAFFDERPDRDMMGLVFRAAEPLLCVELAKSD